MQKAIIIQHSDEDSPHGLDASELNDYLADGWRVAYVAPFGCAAAGGGESYGFTQWSAILVIIQLEDTRARVAGAERSGKRHAREPDGAMEPQE